MSLLVLHEKQVQVANKLFPTDKFLWDVLSVWLLSLWNIRATCNPLTRCRLSKSCTQAAVSSFSSFPSHLSPGTGPTLWQCFHAGFLTWLYLPGQEWGLSGDVTGGTSASFCVWFIHYQLDHPTKNWYFQVSYIWTRETISSVTESQGRTSYSRIFQ